MLLRLSLVLDTWAHRVVHVMLKGRSQTAIVPLIPDEALRMRAEFVRLPEAVKTPHQDPDRRDDPMWQSPIAPEVRAEPRFYGRAGATREPDRRKPCVLK
jgi:hypothetical protein